MRGGESEQRRRSSRRKRRGGGESYHPCVSREAAMDACDNDFASKRRREAQVQQGFRSDDNGGKDETRQKPNDPRHQQHTSTGVASSTTTRHPLTLIDTRPHFQCPPVVWMHGMVLFYFLFYFFWRAVTFFFFFRFCDVARWRSFNSRFNHIWLFTKYRKVKKKI